MKKWLAVLLALCAALALLAGCGAGASQNDPAPADEEEYYNATIEAFYVDEDLRLFTMVESWDEESQTVEYNNIGYMALPGQTVAELMAEFNQSELTVVDEQGTFLGWMKYRWVQQSDENDVVFDVLERMDDLLYTTEEMLATAVEDCSLVFVAKWADIDEGYYAENGY